MKRINQEKKKTGTTKGVKLPLIQNNAKKGNSKENQEGKNSSKSEQKNNLLGIPEMPNIPLTKNLPNTFKSLENTKLSQNSHISKGKSVTKKRKIKYNIIEDSNTQTGTIPEISPRFTEERLSQLREQRRQRLKQTKKEELKEMKVYEKLIEEYRNGKIRKSTKKK